MFLCAAGSNEFVADSASFLFTLSRPSGSETVKISPKVGAAAGIRCLQSYGPVFGNEQYYDLQIWNGRSSYLDLGYAGFTCPPGVDKKTYFTGKNPFDVDEMEVFKIDI